MASVLRHQPYTVLGWLLFSAGLMLVLNALPRPLAEDAFTVILTVIASIYLGFALKDGRKHIVVLEVSIAAGFILLALLGLWVSPYLWLVAYVAHGVWDWLHHPLVVQTAVPNWYPPICVMVDWLLAAYLLVWLWG